MSTRVFWAVVSGCLVGVFIRSFFAVGFSFVAFVVFLGTVTLLLASLDRPKLKTHIVIAIALISCAAGIVRMDAATLLGDPVLTARVGTTVSLNGIVSDEPDAREKSTIIHVDVHSLVGSTSTTLGTGTSVPVSARVLAILPSHALVRYGDEVQLSGKLGLPEPFDTGLGRQFEYPQYLGAQGIGYEIAFARVSTYGNAGNPLRAGAFNLKEKYLEGIRAVLPEPEAALAGGITVGDKRSIGPELTTAFQRDSLVHMIVLSGYNITVVLNAIARSLVWAPRVVQFSGSIFVVAFFILMSGGASSAARSGLMALIAVYARATHRTYLGERALAAVALGMVLWNPWTLAFDPSFQLSALATLGLILFTPIFANMFVRVPERFGMREILASTCATQLMVLPLLLYQNGSLSLVSLPANVLALAPVPLAMFFSFIAALGGMFFGSYAAALALPAYALLWYIVSVAQAFSSLPFAAVSLPAFSVWWVFVAYTLLFSANILLRNRYSQSI